MQRFAPRASPHSTAGSRGRLQALLTTACCLAGSAACGGAAPAEIVRAAHPAVLDPELASLVETHLRAVAEDPDSAAKRGELGLVYEANSLWPEARAAFARALELAPADPSWALHLAIATMQEGAFEEAVSLLRELAARSPGFVPGRQRLGDALLETADYAAASEHFAATVRLAPRAPEGYVGLARVALADGLPEKAARLLQHAVELAPHYGMAHFLLSSAYRRLARPEDAAREESLAGASNKRFLADLAGVRSARYAVGTVTLVARARRHLASGEPHAAIEILERANAAHPGRLEVMNNLAVAYRTVGELPRAIELLQRALREDETNALTHVNLAVAYLDEGDAEKALSSAARALELQPGSARAHFVHGAILLRQQDFEAAHAALGEAHRLDPADARIRAALGEACFRTGRLDQALEQLTVAATEMPEQLSVWILLGHVHLASGQPGEARRALAAARALAPRNPEVRNLRRLLAREDGG